MNEIIVCRLMQQGTELIYSVRAGQGMLWSWYYVHVPKIKNALFLRALKSGAFDLADFGVILASGYGDEPPIEIRQLYGEAESV